MKNRDIILAQKIITGSYNPLKKASYHDSSFIYKITNEDVSSYFNLLKDRERIFSITASGDQILNSILAGSKDITACDISSFPNYFLALKIAAVKSLSLEEYLNFFILADEEKIEFSDKYYDKLRVNLDAKPAEFWDHLFGFFDGDEIYNSSLFSREVYTLDGFKKRNPYIEKENYQLLKRKIDDVHLKYVNTDLGSFKVEFTDFYDLVNLSSILYYDKLNNPDTYLKLLKSFNLSDDGITISYLYDVNKHFRNIYTSNNFSFKKFNDSVDGVMIYQKKK